MSNEEVNKIIAEFMGLDIYGNMIVEFIERGANGEIVDLGRKSQFYTSSLDALVPVWKKLEAIKKISFNLDSQGCIPFRIRVKGNRNPSKGRVSPDIDYRGKSIQEAAAHATAKAIMELRDE